MGEDQLASGDAELEAFAAERWQLLYSQQSPHVDGLIARWTTIGLAAACFAMLLTFAELEPLDDELVTALILFVIAIPAGLVSWMSGTHDLGERFDRFVTVPLGAVAAITGLFGFVFYVSHFSGPAAVLAAVALALAICWLVALSRAQSEKLRRIRILREEALAGDHSAIERISSPHLDFGIPDYIRVEYRFDDRWCPTVNDIAFELSHGPNGEPIFLLAYEHHGLWRRLMILFFHVPRRKATTPDELSQLISNVET